MCRRRILTGLTIKDVADMEAAARKIVEMGARAVIVKGGHMGRPTDVLFDGTEIVALPGERVNEEQLHGTGCTFASALAAHPGRRPRTARSGDTCESLRDESD